MLQTACLSFAPAPGIVAAGPELQESTNSIN
jgi:hypothetical protein